MNYNLAQLLNTVWNYTLWIEYLYDNVYLSLFLAFAISSKRIDNIIKTLSRIAIVIIHMYEQFLLVGFYVSIWFQGDADNLFFEQLI